MKKTMYIKAIQNDEQEYYLQAENGDLPQEGFSYPTKLEAYQAAMQLWPANSIWEGCMTHIGYRIVISDEAGQAATVLGHIKSEKKAAAARQNGRKGGRPRKTQAPE